MHTPSGQCCVHLYARILSRLSPQFQFSLSGVTLVYLSQCPEPDTPAPFTLPHAFASPWHVCLQGHVLHLYNVYVLLCRTNGVSVNKSLCCTCTGLSTAACASPWRFYWTAACALPLKVSGLQKLVLHLAVSVQDKSVLCRYVSGPQHPLRYL
jgi:hypothetical protein